MDGLPKNKRPLQNKHERPSIALDDYLFERKLQEVYDKKAPSNDLPQVLQKLARIFLRKNRQTPTRRTRAIKKQPSYIDAPQQAAAKAPLPEVTAKGKRKSPVFVVHALFGQLKKQAKHLKKHRVIAVSGVAVFTIAVIFVVYNSTNNDKSADDTSVAGVQTEVSRPNFDTLNAPEVQQQKIKFDTSRQVASYEDTIGGARVVVSQQKLAEKDRVDPNFLSRTATAFNLKTEMTTKKGQAFTGVNIDKNIQFTMFVYKDYLVFIQGDESVRNQLIVDYIDSLE